MLPYAELQTLTNFTFLRGASHPQELALAASELGMAAFAVTDRNTLAGVVRAHAAAKELGVRFIVGARLDLQDAPSLLAYPTDRAAYGRLARLLTVGRRCAPKGECHLTLDDVMAHGEGQIFIALPPESGAWEPARTENKNNKKSVTPGLDPGIHDIAPPQQAKPWIAGSSPVMTTGGDAEHFIDLENTLLTLAAAFPRRVYLAAHCLYRGDDKRRLAELAGIAARCGAPLAATNDVQYHEPARRPLQDVLTCIREHCTIDTAGWRLAANAERHMKSPAEMARLFADYPDAIARTVEITEACRFSLGELCYEYPDELTHEGRTPQEELAVLAWEGARWRFPTGLPNEVRTTIERELKLIERLDYAPYFLTVHDIVRYARSQNILCQGRGSAANSVVCFCLGITAVDPLRVDLLFERFVSAERNEPPDIDVDFEHARREEVIQYIYGKYGRERTGLAATVICYRGRSAVREVGKAMGLSLDTVGALAGQLWGWSNEGVAEAQLRELGLDPAEPRLALTLALTRQLIGFPRHLSQHVGGFVMTRGRLDELVPIENAAMEDRTVVEWDKDDLDELKILKVDVLALGMLTCLAKGFELIKRHYGQEFTLATVPENDTATYDMICNADTIGVFQIESRAQMTMLPRLRPRNFYDLVIEVAIVRPGPIQGDMVHPYLRRRNGEEQVTYPSKELEQVLSKTKGVPLFQEQAMRIAIVAAGFTPDEADRLRRAMATFRKVGTIHTFQTKLVEGMVARGYDRGFAERCFRQIEGFGEYGFPESHAASFALLAYDSAWMKCHYPAVFACALLNSQPMGFYAPAQIVRDARDHGVAVLPVDVNCSEWDCTLEPAGGGGYALRLGFRQIMGLAKEEAQRLVAARGNGYGDPLQLWRRAAIGTRALEALARADGFRSMGLDRREALWAMKGLPAEPLPLFAAMGEEEQGSEAVAALPVMGIGEHVAEDYRTLHLSLKRHPLSLLRARMQAQGYVQASRLASIANDTTVKVSGLVLVRQRPGTASGVIFATLEDETGVANIIIWPKAFERFRRTVLACSLMGVTGKLQREGIVIHVIADRIVDLTDQLQDMAVMTEAPEVDQHPPRSNDNNAVMPIAPARADEVKRPGHDHRAKAAKRAPLPRRDPSFPSRDFH